MYKAHMYKTIYASTISSNYSATSRLTWYPSMIKTLLLLISLLLPIAAKAQFDFDNNSSTSSASKPTLNTFGVSSNTDFLPVRSAFKVNLFADNDSSTKTDKLLMQWQIQPGYYLYQQRFNFFLNGAEVRGKTLDKGKIIYDEFFKTDMEVFYNQIDNQLQLPQIQGVLALGFQGCADLGLCYPPETYYFSVDASNGIATPISMEEAQSKLPSSLAGQQSVPNTSGDLGTSENSWLNWLSALLFAFLGGLILNLMPCVFPILSIKAISMIEHAGDRSQGWIYSAGVILSFLTIAAVMLVVRSTGSAAGWGFQLQSPWFISILLMVFFMMALSLSGLTELGTRLMGIGQSMTNKSGRAGTFFSGFFAVLVATPCTAPFMASALGYAILQPTPVALSIFFTLGCGMAAPMLLLSYYPNLAKKLPRSGLWMEQLKQLLAFPLYFTCIWLLWVMAQQIGIDGAMWMLCALLSVGFCLWLKAQWQRPYYVIALLMAALFWWQTFDQPHDRQSRNPNIEAFTLPQLDSQIGGSKPVFVNVTADWCITCIVNERSSLHQAQVIEAFETANVHTITADWTEPNAEISALLKRYNRVGIPLYLWFAPYQQQPQILPQILTPNILLQQLE